MKKRIPIIILLFLALIFEASAQDRTITGKVISAEDESGLPGVNIVVKSTQGTSNTVGTITDFEGNYRLSVPSDASTLVFTSIGFLREEVNIGNRSTVDVTLNPDIKSLSEVVVTAFGMERDKKSLTSSVQEVEPRNMTEARELNVMNSLSGKVAGLSVNKSGSGVGSPTRVILRGNRSISGDSQPLYIVDGVPILGDLSGLSPDIIESITVLKGPNAAALYGSRANNGAIVVTTKRGQDGGVNVSLNTTYMVESPILLTNYQKEYAQGNQGSYSPSSEMAWGPRMTGQTVEHWSPDPNSPATYELRPQNNVRDFFQTGYNASTNLAISAGNERNQTFFSYTFTDAAGVVPNNELTRHNVDLRLTNKLTDKLTLDSKLTYMRENIDNRLTQGESFSNPLRHAYRLPPNIRTEDLRDFDYVNENGLLRQNYWNPGSNGGANPYWTVNRNLQEDVTDRVMGFVSARYEFTDEFSLLVRSAVDRRFGSSETRYYNNSYIFAENGFYGQGRSDAMEMNNDFLATYDKRINMDWAFNVNVGGNNRIQRNSGLTANTGPGLTVPNFFALGNTQQFIASHNVGNPKDVNSLYAFSQISFKDAIFLDLTARNDWSSTLPKDNWSFFYPSVGLNAVVSDLMPNRPDFLTFAKLRASVAEVGNDTYAYQLQRTANLRPGGLGGFLSLSSRLPNENLLPEKTRSIEAGADLRFFKNRLGLDVTYYKTNSTNQLFTVALPVGSGASEFFTNGGNVQNEGVELVLSATPVSVGDFNWDFSFNFARNESLVVEINDERPSIEVGGDFLRRFRIEEGAPFGEVYSRGLLRDDEGRVLVDSDGLPRVTNGFTTRVANYNPDWLGGIRNAFTYKNFRFNFLIDIRQGGSISSLTNAIIYADGLTEETLEGREGGLVFGDNFFPGETAVLENGEANNIPVTAEEFWVKVGGRNAPIGEMFTVDASNVRLREAVLGYQLPASMFGNSPFKSVNISFVARNLFFIQNKAKNIDPDVTVGTGKTSAGYDAFGHPTTRSFGLNLNIGF